jgi:hypothetical protein
MRYQQEPLQQSNHRADQRLDCATRYQRHVQLDTGKWRQTIVEVTASRSAAGLARADQQKAKPIGGKSRILQAAKALLTAAKATLTAQAAKTRC